MENSEILIQLQKDINEIKAMVKRSSTLPYISDKWLPKSEVTKFLNYGNTQMYTLEQSGALVTTKVGRRVFILRESLEKLLEKNIVK